MTAMLRTSITLVLVLLGRGLDAQPPTRPVGPVDSIVLVRTFVPGWPCPECPPQHVAVRRGAAAEGRLAQVALKADSIGFYALPADLLGKSICRTVMSDALMATIAIYHTDGWWSVRGYRHCAERGPVQRALIAIEALVDSIHAAPRAPDRRER